MLTLHSFSIASNLPKRGFNLVVYDIDTTKQPSDSYGMMNELPQSAFPDAGNNPALRILDARQRIQQEAEEELENVGRQSFRGRNYVDASTITLALMRRQRGEPDARIEEALGIKKGRLSTLREGMVTSV